MELYTHRCFSVFQQLGLLQEEKHIERVSFHFPTIFSWTKVGNHPRFIDTQNIANQRIRIRFGGDFCSTFYLHLLEHRKRSYSALFCVLRENKNSRFRLEIRSLLLFAFLQSGATRNRTGDTRIFSPLLYHLSYGTSVFACAKVMDWFEFTKYSVAFSI